MIKSERKTPMHPLLRRAGNLAAIFSPESFTKGVMADRALYFAAEHGVDMLSSRFSDRETLAMRWAQEAFGALKRSRLGVLNWFPYSPACDDDVAISTGAVKALTEQEAKGIAAELNSVAGGPYFNTMVGGNGNAGLTIGFPVYYRTLFFSVLQKIDTAHLPQTNTILPSQGATLSADLEILN